MKFVPHEYQKKAIEFIRANREAALFLDMGLGKTVITLTAIREMVDAGEVKRVLVIAPLRVAAVTWPEEIQKWDHVRDLSFSVATGSIAQRFRAGRAETTLTIINRENIPWLIDATAAGTIDWVWDMVVIDELSSFKNHQSARFQALMRRRDRFSRVLGLTGTPAPNGLIDLWAQFRVLDNGVRLGRSIGRYRTAYFEPDKRNAQVIFSYKPLPGSEPRIYDRIADMTLSMQSRDYLRLPELTTTPVWVELSRDERKRYEELKRDAVLQLPEGEITALNAAVLAEKLLQLSNGAVYADDRSGGRGVVPIHGRKLDALTDLIESANGQPVLIAYRYRHDLTRISALLTRLKPGFDVLDDAASIAAWNAGKLGAGLIHPMSAGHGLNLQAGGSKLIWFSLPWSLELYQQTVARLYRQGQDRTVSVFHILARGTMDEAVAQALVRKDLTQERLLRAVRAAIGGDKG